MGHPATEEPNCVDSQESTQFFKNILLHTLTLLHTYYILSLHSQNESYNRIYFQIKCYTQLLTFRYPKYDTERSIFFQFNIE